MTPAEYLLFFIGFTGITGHIPYTSMGVMTSLSDLFLKALGLMGRHGGGKSDG